METRLPSTPYPESSMIPTFYDLRHASIFALSPTCRNTTSRTTRCRLCIIWPSDRLAHVGGEEYLSDITRNTGISRRTSIGARHADCANCRPDKVDCCLSLDYRDGPSIRTRAATLEEYDQHRQSTIVAIRDGQAREKTIWDRKKSGGFIANG